MNSEVLVNVGCGSTPIPGWLNVDNSWTVRLSRYPLLLKSLFRAGLVNESWFVFAWTVAVKKTMLADAVQGATALKEQIGQ